MWPDELWIHDRGFQPDTMEFIYGNQRGVPYRLERVTNIVEDSNKTDPNRPKRTVIQPLLSWTLGSEFRTEKEYEAKLQVVGGGSRPKR